MASKRKTPFTKVILNVPTSLLEDFDYATAFQNYSRSEGIKEAMRQFIIEQMPEGMYPPSQQKEVERQGIITGSTILQGMAEGVKNLPPEMQQQQYPNLSVNDTTTEGKPRSRKRLSSKRQKLSDTYKKGK